MHFLEFQSFKNGSPGAWNKKTYNGKYPKPVKNYIESRVWRDPGTRPDPIFFSITRPVSSQKLKIWYVIFGLQNFLTTCPVPSRYPKFLSLPDPIPSRSKKPLPVRAWKAHKLTNWHANKFTCNQIDRMKRWQDNKMEWGHVMRTWERLTHKGKV